MRVAIWTICLAVLGFMTVILPMTHLKYDSATGHLLRNAHLSTSCGLPTCTECANCCWADDSYVDVVWDYTADTTGWSTESADWFNSRKSGTKRIPWKECGTFGVPTFELVDGSVTYTVTYSAGFWNFTLAEDVPAANPFTDMSIANRDAQFTGDCCGVTTAGPYDIELNLSSSTGSRFVANAGDTTLDVGNNRCCKCDVSATPTCIPSTKDYADDCTSGINECNQFTGSEAVCDDAP